MLTIIFLCFWFAQFNGAAGRDGFLLAASSMWIVDVQDVLRTHQCSGSLISSINALTACSCVMSPDMKRKLPRRIVHTFKGETQERTSSNHFPHLWCEPVGKAGRPTYNYAITRTGRPFKLTSRLIYMPFPLPFDTDWNIGMEYRFKSFFSFGLKDCESVGWTYAEVDKTKDNNKKILNLTSSNVKPSGNQTVTDLTWLIGRILVERSGHDGTPGRNLICDGFPYGFLDSWPGEDGLERYYRADHIIRWVFSNSLPPIEFEETENKNSTKHSFTPSTQGSV